MDDLSPSREKSKLWFPCIIIADTAKESSRVLKNSEVKLKKWELIWVNDSFTLLEGFESFITSMRKYYKYFDLKGQAKYKRRKTGWLCFGTINK